MKFVFFIFFLILNVVPILVLSWVQMVEILFQFAEYALKKCPEHGKIQVMEQHFHVRKGYVTALAL